MRRSPLQLAMAAGVAGAACLAHAQPAPTDEGPVVIGAKRSGWRTIELINVDAAVEYQGRRNEDRVTRRGEADVKSTSTLSKEMLDLGGEASFGHRNLVDLTAKVRFELEEQRDRSDALGLRQSSRNLNALFDVDAHVLGTSRFPMDLYARRDQLQLHRDFASSLTQTSSEYGFTGMLQSSVAPTQIRVFRHEDDQHDTLGQFSYALEQNSVSVQSTVLFTDHHRLEAQWTFDDITENQKDVYADSYLRNDASLNDVYTFGDSNAHELRSNFRFYEQGGRQDQQTIRQDEQLRLRHSDSLESRHTLSAERLTRGGAEQDTFRGTSGLRHTLFQSLVSSVNVGAQRLSTGTGFDSSDVFTNGSLEYTKHVPMGLFTATVGASLDHQDNGEQGSVIPVLDQSFVYADPFPITISRRNVVTNSVHVTGPGGFPTFIEGYDYTIVYFADRVEIRPILGRGIPNGANVLVDYDVGPEPANTIDTLSTIWSARYTVDTGWLEGASVYTTYRTTDHSLSGADPAVIVLDDVRELLLGAEYRRWGLTLRAEREYHDSTTNPYDTTRFQGLYDMRLGQASTLSLDASHDIIEYAAPANTVDFTRLGAHWIQQLTQSIDVDTRAAYRLERSDASGDSNGVDWSVSLRWHLRQTSAYVSVGNASAGNDVSKTTSSVMEIGFRREF